MSQKLQMDPELTLERRKKKHSPERGCTRTTARAGIYQVLVSSFPTPRTRLTASGSSPFGLWLVARTALCLWTSPTGRSDIIDDYGVFCAAVSLPALSATCHKCNRKGHYGSQCLSKTVAAITQEVEAGPVEEAFLGTVTPIQKLEADSS